MSLNGINGFFFQFQFHICTCIPLLLRSLFIIVFFVKLHCYSRHCIYTLELIHLFAQTHTHHISADDRFQRAYIIIQRNEVLKWTKKQQRNKTLKLCKCWEKKHYIAMTTDYDCCNCNRKKADKMELSCSVFSWMSNEQRKCMWFMCVNSMQSVICMKVGTMSSF